MSAASPPYTGRCLCGFTQYSVTEEPFTVYACHCTDCQKRTGGSFKLSMCVSRAAIQVTAGEATLHAASIGGGRTRNGRICASCATRLWSEPEARPHLAVINPGTLDNTAWFEPVAHLFTRSAQPWFIFPKGVAKYETKPEDPEELVRLWRVRQNRQTPHAT